MPIAPQPIEAFPQTDRESVGIVCNEVWGGNRYFHGPVELPGMRGVLFSQPCDGARGGDVHYLSVCGSGLVSRLCLADVTGHGESVAAVSAEMHELLRRSVNRLDERKVLRRLNLRLTALENDAFTTAAALTYFPPTRRMSISYAGHEPAWYYEASRARWTKLDTTHRDGLFDIPLAVERKTRYTRHRRKVAMGDRILLLTDGVLETPDALGALFGRERLEAVLQNAGDIGPQDLAAKVLEELRKHAGPEQLQHDDISLLTIEFVDNLGSSAFWTA